MYLLSLSDAARPATGSAPQPRPAAPARRAAPLAILLLLGGGTLIASPAGEQMATDLLPIKEYTLANAVAMQEGTEALRAVAADYGELLTAHGFDYDAAWEAQADDLRRLVSAGRDAWVQASTAYELSEGIIAGVPSLAYYDVWIDAGPSAAEDPNEALDWTLTITAERVLKSPGNLFHHLTEPVLWGTKADWNAAQVDLDADGAVGRVGDALPEAALFLAVAGAIDDAAAEMEQAVAGWEPNLNDVFTALVVMVPTMNEYFGQWKESRYVAGDASREASFIAVSRLFDINGILTGLDLAYRHVTALVAESDPSLDARIRAGFDQLTGYVGDLYEQERAGRQYTATEADLFGTEAQELATTLAALLARAAEVLEITLDLA